VGDVKVGLMYGSRHVVRSRKTSTRSRERVCLVERTICYQVYAFDQDIYSGTTSPEPPSSAGKSFSLGRPSFMGRTVSA
jgi:hypothetical protein